MKKSKKLMLSLGIFVGALLIVLQLAIVPEGFNPTITKDIIQWHVGTVHSAKEILDNSKSEIDNSQNFKSQPR